MENVLNNFFGNWNMGVLLLSRAQLINGVY